jgi:hypothetical protein
LIAFALNAGVEDIAQDSQVHTAFLEQRQDESSDEFEDARVEGEHGLEGVAELVSFGHGGVVGGPPLCILFVLDARNYFCQVLRFPTHQTTSTTAQQAATLVHTAEETQTANSLEHVTISLYATEGYPTPATHACLGLVPLEQNLRGPLEMKPHSHLATSTPRFYQNPDERRRKRTATHHVG